MYLCPLCNQLETKSVECSNCQHLMDDRGRLMDYFDDYSAYLDIEGMKQFDGYDLDGKQHKCPHVFYCTQCSHNKVVLIQEQPY
jgi:hypothetical protein